MSAAAFTLVTLACGWLALWPLRTRLGALGFHLAAFPLGLLGWVAVAGFASLTGGGWDAGDVGLGLGAFVAAASLLSWKVVSTGSDGRTPPAWTFLAWAAGSAALAWGLHTWGITAGTYDSVFHYSTWSVWLADGNGLTTPLAGAFGVLLPAIGAGGDSFGISWMSTPWPLLAGHVLGLVGLAVWDGRPRISRRLSAIVAAVVLALLITTAPFIGHAIYLHSHMVTACFLLLALVGIERGLARGGGAEHGAWLWVAGLAMVGLALARVDGLAYAAVPLLVAGVTRIARGLPARSLMPLLVAFGAPIGLYGAAAYAALGVWQSEKLSGAAMAAVLAGLVVLATLSLWADRLPLVGARIAQRPGRWVGLGAVLAVVLVAALRWETTSEAARLMASNLFVYGRFGTLWYVITAMIVLSVVSRSAWRTDDWPDRLLLAIWLFAAAALAVHGTGHPGRIGPGDSFSRVAFHIVPVVFWYGGLFAKGLLSEAGPAQEPGTTGER